MPRANAAAGAGDGAGPSNAGDSAAADDGADDGAKLSRPQDITRRRARAPLPCGAARARQPGNAPSPGLGCRASAGWKT
jgi:hypothetical protein